MWHFYEHINEYPRTRLGFLVLLYVLPVLAIAYGIIPFEYRHEFGAIVLIIVLGYVYYKGHSIKDLGIRMDNFSPAAKLFMPATICVSIGLYLAYFSAYFPLAGNPTSFYFYAFYFAISCPVQEFLFRSVLFAELKNQKDIEYSRTFKIAFTTAIFTLLHLIYFNYLMLFLSLGMGIVWGFIYEKHPNLFAASIAHFIVGSLAFYLQLV